MLYNIKPKKESDPSSLFFLNKVKVNNNNNNNNNNKGEIGLEVGDERERETIHVQLEGLPRT